MSTYRAWDLPTSLEIGGVGYEIRTDFRDILKILSFFDSPDYSDTESWEICLRILYKDWRKIPEEHIKEAAEKAREFIDCGMSGGGSKKKPRKLMDWDQDAQIIIPAINKVLGFEVRSVSYMHWWTFFGAYLEIGEGVFSSVVSIRSKKAKGKNLEKWEKEYYQENKWMIDLKTKYTKEEMEEQKRLKELLD